MRDYKRHTCTRGIPSIQDPYLELYYVYNDHISIHNSRPLDPPMFANALSALPSPTMPLTDEGRLFMRDKDY
jgi:hypothetical protein